MAREGTLERRSLIESGQEIIAQNLSVIRLENQEERAAIRHDNFIYTLVENGVSIAIAVLLAIAGYIIRRHYGSKEPSTRVQHVCPTRRSSLESLRMEHR